MLVDVGVGGGHGSQFVEIAHVQRRQRRQQLQQELEAGGINVIINSILRMNLQSLDSLQKVIVDLPRGLELVGVHGQSGEFNPAGVQPIHTANHISLFVELQLLYDQVPVIRERKEGVSAGFRRSRVQCRQIHRGAQPIPKNGNGKVSWKREKGRHRASKERWCEGERSGFR